jgi:HNH endonuclease
LEELFVAPEQVIAEATRSSARDVDRLLQRAQSAQAAPSFGTALADGKIAAGHVDQLGQTLRRLDSGQRSALLEDSARLLAIAANSTPEDFARTLRREERRLSADDGMSRLQRQQQAVRLRTRIEPDMGMHVWTLTLDPVTGLKLYNRMQAATEALFHTSTPDGCPTDPLEKQSFLRAHALLSLLDGQGVSMGRPEVVVVVDTTSADHPPVVDWALPIEIPDRVLRELWGRADVHAVIVRNGVVLHAPGQLDLGRSTRLANRAQRRALRALYARCAIPGCAARFDTCTIHHIIWWRNGGRTDLCNLLPLCSKHHQLVHKRGWGLHLDAERTLTITLPDATTMTTGPPRRAAA